MFSKRLGLFGAFVIVTILYTLILSFFLRSSSKVILLDNENVQQNVAKWNGNVMSASLLTFFLLELAWWQELLIARKKKRQGELYNRRHE